MNWHTRLTQARTAKKIKKVDFAKMVGVSPPTVTQWENEATQEIKGENLIKVCDALGITPGWLLHGKDDLEVHSKPRNDMEAQSDVEDAPSVVGALKKIPVVGRVQAGPDGLLHIDDYHPGHADGYMLWWSTCANAYALRIRGESMSPRYLPGEFVGVDPCADVNPSDEVIVLLSNGQRMIKRLLWRRDDQACFESVNKNFQNIVLDLEEIDKLHLVLGNIPKAAFRSE